jgi:tight adherence protein B
LLSGPSPVQGAQAADGAGEGAAREGVTAAAQAQIRKLMAARASRFEGSRRDHPAPGAASQAAGDDRQGHQPRQICAISLGLAVIVMALLMLRGRAVLPGLFVGLFVGIGLPHFVVGKMIKRRINKFNSNFPDAIELMVRGLRSGLPISETLGVVANEIPGRWGSSSGRSPTR